MSLRRMLAGANHYYQGEDILHLVGQEAADKGIRKILAIGGKKALSAAWERLEAGLISSGVGYILCKYSGYTTAADIDLYSEICMREGCEAVVGIGGGKLMDLAKAVAAQVKCPVFNVPTSAATCACFAPLSVIYSDSGSQTGIRFFDNEVDAVFVDLALIAKAPERLLAAGMADAMAKSCEYSSTLPELSYGDIDTAKYCGYKLALSADEILLACGAQAYEDVKAHRVSQALEDAVFASVAVIGVVSGMCGYTNKPGGRFAIAHGFNEIIRGRWEKDPLKFLHGEIVAVGILAQLHLNGKDEQYISTVRNFFKSINIPTTLTELGISLEGEALQLFRSEAIARMADGEKYASRIIAAVDSVI